MKTKKIVPFFCLLLAMSSASAVFTACSNDDPASPLSVEPTFSVEPATIEATAAAASYLIAVTSSNTWTAKVSTDSEWCTLSNDAIGTGGLMVNVAANTEGTTRSATITIRSGKLSEQVTVTQAASTLSVDTTPISTTATEGTYSIAVTSNSAWTATVSSDSEWCTISPATGTGNGTITVNVAGNGTISDRSATITVSLGSLPEQVITVTQTAGDAVLSVFPTAIPATADGGTYSIAVTSNGTWTATVSSESEWCTISTGNGTITVNVAENGTISERSATITVSLESLPEQAQVITVTQAAGKAPLSDITAKVSTGGTIVDAVKVYSQNFVIAEGKYENGGFTLNLLTPVPDEYLKPLFEDEELDEEGLTVSDTKANYFIFYGITAYNGEYEVGQFWYGGASGVNAIACGFIYVDRDVKATGSFSEYYDDVTYTYNFSLNKGWNKLYETYPVITINNSSHIEFSSTEPIGLKWNFDDWSGSWNSDVSPTRVAKVANPLFGGASALRRR